MVKFCQEAQNQLEGEQSSDIEFFEFAAEADAHNENWK